MGIHQDYYQVLQVSPDSNQRTIRASYRRLAKKLHPDRGGQPESMMLVNEAYHVLSDPVRRREYDESLGVHKAGRVARSPEDAGEELEGSLENYKNPPSQMPQTRPWVRFCARFIDTLIYIWLALASLVLLSTAVLPSGIRLGDIKLYSPSSLIWFIFFTWSYLLSFMVLLEALILARWGNTPGKWLMHILIYDLSEERIQFGRALRRSFLVWLIGLGLGIPPIAPLTLTASYQRLNRLGTTVWDEAGAFFVAHQDLCPFRIIAALFTLVLIVSSFLFLLGNQ